jgi:hypothetical protein
MRGHLNRTDITAEDVINIADLHGENLDMTPDDIHKALCLSRASDPVDEQELLETIKYSHSLLKSHIF